MVNESVKASGRKSSSELTLESPKKPSKKTKRPVKSASSEINLRQASDLVETKRAASAFPIPAGARHSGPTRKQELALNVLLSLLNLTMTSKSLDTPSDEKNSEAVG